MTRHQLLCRTRDVALYFVIGAAIVVTFLAWGTHQIDLGREPQEAIRWFALAAFIVVTFGYPVRWLRRYLRRPRFWILLGVLVIAHLAAYVFALERVSTWPYLLFALVMPLEWGVIVPILRWAGSGKWCRSRTIASGRHPDAPSRH